MNIYILTIIIGFSIGFQAHALIPVEGLLLGEADPSLQEDPLKLVFTSKEGSPVQDAKLKAYQQLYTDGMELVSSCSRLQGSRYASPLQEKDARRSITATLQLIGLDSSIKGVGAYARKLELGQEQFEKLKNNLVRNYCSKNITILSLRNIEKSLQHYYENPEETLIPSYNGSAFASGAIKESSEKFESRQKEFNHALRAFRSFCSWGGDVDDYRMLPAYLNNPFVHTLVINRLTTPVPEGLSSKVICRDLICRQATDPQFKNQFPLSVGSTGLKTDLQKQYCSHFRNLSYRPKDTIPEIAEWIKESELEGPILETNFFISLLTGMPDLFFGVKKYSEIPQLAKSSIDDRWQAWAKNVLENFSRELYFEESLKVKPRPRRNPADLSVNGFRVDFDVTLGEIDRLMNENDKLSMQFELKLPKNYLRSLLTKWNDIARRLATDEQQDFFAENARYISQYLWPKESLLQQKMWNEDFARLVSSELLGQILKYDGKIFSSYKEEMITIPVTFSYGLFALNYLHYRADINKDRLKVNL